MARKNIIFGPLRKLKALIWHQLYGLVVPAQYREYVNTVAKIRIMQTDSRYQNHEYWTQKLRQAAHILDKGINTDQWFAITKDKLMLNPEIAHRYFFNEDFDDAARKVATLPLVHVSPG